MDILDLISTVGTIGGGAYAASQAKKAAKSQEKAAMLASESIRPYSELGDYAAGQLKSRLNNNALLGDFTLKDFRADPGYQFRLSEGEKAIDRAAGARGKRYSGATLKGMQRFAQGLASSEFDRAYNRDNVNKTRTYNFLAGPINAGQGASSTVGQFLSNAGDARASGTVGASNALVGGLEDAFNNLMLSRYLKQPQTYLVAP